MIALICELTRPSILAISRESARVISERLGRAGVFGVSPSQSASDCQGEGCLRNWSRRAEVADGWEFRVGEVGSVAIEEARTASSRPDSALGSTSADGSR